MFILLISWQPYYLGHYWGGNRGELSMRIFRIQKRVIRSMVGVSSRTSCRQLFKELSILTLASLYIFKVTCFIRKYCQSLEQILRFINIIHEESWLSMLNCKKNEIYKKSVINMGTKVYKKLPQFLKEIDDYKAFKKELKLFLLLQTFYSVEEFVSS